MHKYGPMGKTDYTIEDYAYSFATWSAWKPIWNEVCQPLYETVKQGGKAPNPKVLSQDGATVYSLLDFAKPGRPLVLNFGSCSWPPFMAELADLSRVAADFADNIDFVTVYITEAHALDAWHLAGNRYVQTYHHLWPQLLQISVANDSQHLV